MDRRSLLEMFSFGQKAPEAETGPVGSVRLVPSVRYVMAIDVRRCVGCQACTVACAMENRTPLGSQRTFVSDFEVLDGDRPRKSPVPRLCNHCKRPPCVRACPVQATYQRPDGLVLVDPARCVGCGYCVLNCPYGARFLNHYAKTADKCSLCAHRLDAGLLPACVETCIGKARIMGDANDPDSAVSRLLAEAGPAVRVLKPEAGTEPMVFYLGLAAGTPVEMPGSEILPLGNPGTPGHVRITEENFR